MGCTALVACANAPSQETSKLFDQNRAWSYLLKQCDFGPRIPGSDAHLKCRDWLVEQMKESCENVRLQELSHTWSQTNKKVTMWNVVGEQNWESAKVRVLLLAHWDTRPYADQDPDEKNRTKPITGANDGASGVAVLLELMRTMKGKLPKDVGVMYLMTDGEDLGPSLEEMFLGATHFAKNPPKPRPDYGILLDMIGDKDLRVPVERNSFEYAPSVIRGLYAHAKTVGLSETFPNVFGGYIEDDHISLNRAGIPTVDLIDFTYEPWHTVHDTPDKCSAASLGKVGKLLETWLLKDPAFSP